MVWFKVFKWLKNPIGVLKGGKKLHIVLVFAGALHHHPIEGGEPQGVHCAGDRNALLMTMTQPKAEFYRGKNWILGFYQL